MHPPTHTHTLPLHVSTTHPRIQDNLFVWGVELSDFPKDTPLAEDLEAYAKKSNRKPVVELEMKFPKDYPMNPPFVRILRPRFKFLTGMCNSITLPLFILLSFPYVSLVCMRGVKHLNLAIKQIWRMNTV